MLKRLALVSCLLAAPLAAQETLVLDPCWDGANGGGSQTEAEMAKFLAGTWKMSATGTGLTLGTNIMAVKLSFSEASGTLKMGSGGMKVDLVPVRFDGENAPFDMSTEALTPLNLSENDLEVLGVCSKPARYFWQLNAGGNKSWGGLMFYDKNAAVGFMANSAGGSRNVVMQR